MQKSTILLPYALDESPIDEPKTATGGAGA
jgi:hypothetical protein